LQTKNWQLVTRAQRGGYPQIGAVEKPCFGADVRPHAEVAIRNRRSSVTCTGVILSASLMEHGEALFQQPQITQMTQIQESESDSLPSACAGYR
jgi:hypothetical protein